jgi:hypothetical protein
VEGESKVALNTYPRAHVMTESQLLGFWVANCVLDIFSIPEGVNTTQQHTCGHTAHGGGGSAAHSARHSPAHTAITHSKQHAATH